MADFNLLSSTQNQISPRKNNRPGSANIFDGPKLSPQVEKRRSSVMDMAKMFQTSSAPGQQKPKPIPKGPADGPLSSEDRRRLQEQASAKLTSARPASLVDLFSRIDTANKQNACPACTKPVYTLSPECTLVDGVPYHNWCFKCASCSEKLSNGTGNYHIHNGTFFCSACSDRMFNMAKSRRYKGGGDESGLSAKEIAAKRERESALVKKGTRESLVEWDQQATFAGTLVAGWADGVKAPQGNPVVRPNETVDAPVQRQRRMSAEFGFASGYNSPESSNPASPEPRAPSPGGYGFHEIVDENPQAHFEGAGASPGVEIWRVEGSKLVKKMNEPQNDRPAPNVGVDAHKGTLYEGDMYLILTSTSRANGKRVGQIYLWIGKNYQPSDSAPDIFVEIDALKERLRPLFKDGVPDRRIEQGNEQGFLRKFQDDFANRRKNFKVSYKPGSYSVVTIEDMLTASEAFNDRLIKVHLTGNNVVLEQVEAIKASITEDSVFILETFGKVYQYNGLQTKPIERHQGKKKMLAICDVVEEGTWGARPYLDAEIIMQTRMATSKAETTFFKAVERKLPPWKPMTMKQKTKTMANLGKLRRTNSKSEYEGTKWTVKDTTLYEHSTSFFGGRNSHGPGRSKAALLATL